MTCPVVLLRRLRRGGSKLGLAGVIGDFVSVWSAENWASLLTSDSVGPSSFSHGY